jgi:hypothetical protein
MKFYLSSLFFVSFSLLAAGVPDRPNPDFILTSPMSVEAIAKRHYARFPYLKTLEYKKLLLEWNTHLDPKEEIVPIGTEIYLHQPSSPFVSGSTYHPTLTKGISQNKRWYISIGSLSNAERFQQKFGAAVAEQTRVSPLGFSIKGEYSWSDIFHLEGLLRFISGGEVEVAVAEVDKVDFASTLYFRTMAATHFNLWNKPSYLLFGFGRLDTQLLNLEIIARTSILQTQKLSPIVGYLGWQHRFSYSARFQQRLSLMIGRGIQETANPFNPLGEGYLASHGELILSHHFGKSLRLDTSVEYVSVDGPSTLSTAGVKLETHFVF